MEGETPGTFVILLIYLVVFTLGYLVMFWNLGTKWPIG